MIIINNWRVRGWCCCTDGSVGARHLADLDSTRSLIFFCFLRDLGAASLLVSRDGYMSTSDKRDSKSPN